MITSLVLLAGGVALYALAGSALSGCLAGRANDQWQCRALWLLPLALGGPVALVSLACGVEVVDRLLGLQALGLPPWLVAALSVVPVGLLAGGLLLLAVLPRRRGGGGGGSGPDDLPPPPDPDGPDGWAEFERQFRAFAAARDQYASRVLVR